jgi:hypothetical protein
VTGAVTYSFQLRNLTTGVTVQDITNLPTPTWTAPTDLPTGNYRWWSLATGANLLAGNWSAPTDFNVGGSVRFTTPSATYNTTPVFNWLAVGGAARYEIQINRVDIAQFNVVRQSNLTGTSFIVTTPLVAGGSYRIWIRAISTTGEVGQWSNTLEFSVARADSTVSDEAPFLDLVSLEMLDDLIGELLENKAQPIIMVASRRAVEVPASTQISSTGADPIDLEMVNDAVLLRIDEVINSIVTDLLIQQPLT